MRIVIVGAGLGGLALAHRRAVRRRSLHAALLHGLEDVLTVADALPPVRRAVFRRQEGRVRDPTPRPAAPIRAAGR